MLANYEKLFEKFYESNNKYISKNIKNLRKLQQKKIFDFVNSYSLDSEIRYVGGCRKIINKVDDIDLTTNLEPSQICDILKKMN